jgi:hypothetical protein
MITRVKSDQDATVEVTPASLGPRAAVPAHAVSAPIANVAALQRAVGNQAMGRLVRQSGAVSRAVEARLLQRDLFGGYGNSPSATDTNVVDRIHMIDERGVSGWLNAALFIGEIAFTNVNNLVENVLSELGTRKVRRLDIDDHGNEEGMELGDDWVSESNLATYAPVLQRLRGKFTSNGFVHLQGCHVGANRRFLVAVAEVVGVPVWAGTGYDAPGYGLNLGTYVRASPDGSFQTGFWRPR